MTSEKYTISKPETTGTYNSPVYHHTPDCRRLAESPDRNITTVSDSDINRYNLRECPDCGSRNAESLLKQMRGRA